MADDEDPLEQFMAEIEQVTQQYQDTSDEKQTTANNNDDCINKVVHANTPVSASAKHNDDKRDLDEEMAPGEGYDPKRDANADLIRFRRLQGEETDANVRRFAQTMAKSSHRYTEEEAEEDQEKAKGEFLLQPVDHSKIDYEPFRKCFYNVSEAIKSLSPAQAALRRREYDIEIIGPKVPHMISDFTQSGLDKPMRDAITRYGYDKPTPIQAQALPIIMSGRDMIGIAMTGSGKTLAYGWPVCVHCIDQREIIPGEGPIAIILAPTRELVQQVYQTLKPFTKVYGLTTIPVYGGASRWEQKKVLQEGAEIIIATPGRLIDLIKDKATNLQRVTMIVLDEADKMLEMGFEKAVISLLHNVRPDRQTVMFSATFRKQVEKLALQYLMSDAIRVTIGQKGSANPNIEQHACVLDGNSSKWPWLESHLKDFLGRGRLLVFVNSKDGSEALAESINNWFTRRNAEAQRSYGSTTAHGEVVASAAPTASISQRALALHGDKDQIEREKTITAFKKGHAQVLVATDIASRGLDIPLVQTVVSYDTPRKIDTHTHRIGRTGRLGGDSPDEYNPGLAYSLLTRNEAWFAGELVKHLESSHQQVPPELLQLAMTDTKFRAVRNRDGTPRRMSHKPMSSTLPVNAGIGFSSSSGATGVGSRRPMLGSQSVASNFNEGGKLSSINEAAATGVFSGENSASNQIRKQAQARTAQDFMGSFQKASHGILGSEDPSAINSSMETSSTSNNGAHEREQNADSRSRRRKRTRWGSPADSNTSENSDKRSNSLAAAVEAAAQQARENALQRGLMPAGNSLYVKGVKY